MKKLEEILKPIAIFSIYIIISGLIAQIISIWSGGDIAICSLIPMMLLYPVYLYYIQQ